MAAESGDGECQHGHRLRHPGVPGGYDRWRRDGEPDRHHQLRRARSSFTTGMATGTKVLVSGVPQPDGSVKAYVITYFTGTTPMP